MGGLPIMVLHLFESVHDLSSTPLLHTDQGVHVQLPVHEVVEVVVVHSLSAVFFSPVSVYILLLLEQEIPASLPGQSSFISSCPLQLEVSSVISTCSVFFIQTALLSFRFFLR